MQIRDMWKCRAIRVAAAVLLLTGLAAPLAAQPVLPAATNGPAQLDLPVPATGRSLTLVGQLGVVDARWRLQLLRGTTVAADLAPYARPGGFRFLPGLTGLTAAALNTLVDVPVLCVEPGENIDVGLSRWLGEGGRVGYCDNDATRSAFDGCPESIILQVPTENYVAAHVLCAVEPSDTKHPVLTVRVTRFGRHYGDSGGRCDEASVHTTVRLPRATADPLPAGVQKVGGVAAATEGGKTTLPLYLVTIPLKMGEIVDLLGEDAPDFARGHRYLDLELTKEIRAIGSRRRPSGPASSVHVFGLTLERSPVDVRLSSGEPGNILYAAQDPAFDVRFVNRQTAALELDVQWSMADYVGGVTTETARVTVPVPGVDGGETGLRIPLARGRLGYFDFELVVRDARSGRELWREPTSFALLPPDTRQAGAESPFGTWWFCGVHGSCKDVSRMGPVLMRMGMRHVCPAATRFYTERELAPYKLSFSMASYRGLKDEAAVDTFLTNNPSVSLGMIFHETGVPDVPSFPPELIGEPKPELSTEGRKKLDELWKDGMERARLYRTKHPRVKITLGNSHSPFLVELMRQGWPKAYLDCIGIEGVSGWSTTETQPQRWVTQEIWWIKELQRVYGYDDIPVSSGYEYITRGTQRGALSEREQAELYVRDALHCLAYGYSSINIGATEDWADSYNGTIYGGGGFVRRNPLLTPKPSYVAWATMTRMLDGARYARYLETGSRSLYVLEFSTRSGYVYPFWTVRGRRQLTVTLSDGTSASMTDDMGNRRELRTGSNEATLEATSAPAYLVTSRPLTAVRPGPITHDAKPWDNAVVVSGFSDPAAWDMDHGAGKPAKRSATSVPGTFERTEALRAVLSQQLPLAYHSERPGGPFYGEYAAALVWSRRNA